MSACPAVTRNNKKRVCNSCFAARRCSRCDMLRGQDEFSKYHWGRSARFCVQCAYKPGQLQQSKQGCRKLLCFARARTLVRTSRTKMCVCAGREAPDCCAPEEAKAGNARSRSRGRGAATSYVQLAAQLSATRRRISSAVFIRVRMGSFALHNNGGMCKRESRAGTPVLDAALPCKVDVPRGRIRVKHMRPDVNCGSWHAPQQRNKRADSPRTQSPPKNVIPLDPDEQRPARVPHVPVKKSRGRLRKGARSGYQSTGPAAAGPSGQTTFGARRGAAPRRGFV